MQDFYVRAKIHAFLWNVDSTEDSQFRQIIEQIMEAFLELNSSPAYSTECRLSSHQHFKRIRLWQAIALILGKHMAHNQRLASLTRQHIFASLETPNFRSVRIYIELCSANFFLQHPDAIDEKYFEFLLCVNASPELITSGIIMSGMVIRSLDATHPSCLKIWLGLLPYLSSHHQAIRCIAQTVVVKIFESRPDLILSLEEALRQQVNLVVHYLQTNTKIKSIVDKQARRLLLDATPTSKLNPEDILYSIPIVDEMPSAEHIHAEVFQLISHHPERAGCSLLIPPSAEDLGDSKHQIDVRSINTESEEKENEFFQKKIIPRNVLEVEVEEKIIREQAFDQKRQQLVVVASLIDKIPNLAGLARTCEILRVSCLVLPSLKLTKEALFQSISVGAEKWMPLLEVNENDLASFLEEKRKEGYSLLGVEQASGSIMLDQFIFPSKCLLLLGREKQGIPPQFIHLLDSCIEIPQLGMIRSLNVHVSASIVMWEYTRQQRQVQK